MADNGSVHNISVTTSANIAAVAQSPLIRIWALPFLRRRPTCYGVEMSTSCVAFWCNRLAWSINQHKSMEITTIVSVCIHCQIFHDIRDLLRSFRHPTSVYCDLRVTLLLLSVPKFIYPSPSSGIVCRTNSS